MLIITLNNNCWSKIVPLAKNSSPVLGTNYLELKFGFPKTWVRVLRTAHWAARYHIFIDESVCPQMGHLPAATVLSQGWRFIKGTYPTGAPPRRRQGILLGISVVVGCGVPRGLPRPVTISVVARVYFQDGAVRSSVCKVLFSAKSWPSTFWYIYVYRGRR